MSPRSGGAVVGISARPAVLISLCCWLSFVLHSPYNPAAWFTDDVRRPGRHILSHDTQTVAADIPDQLSECWFVSHYTRSNAKGRPKHNYVFMREYAFLVPSVAPRLLRKGRHAAKEIHQVVPLGVFALFDGHGRYGHIVARVATMLAARAADIVFSALQAGPLDTSQMQRSPATPGVVDEWTRVETSSKPPATTKPPGQTIPSAERIQVALQRIFDAVDTGIYSASIGSSGTTFSMAVWDPYHRLIYVANVGDSLILRGWPQKNNVDILSNDHSMRWKHAQDSARAAMQGFGMYPITHLNAEYRATVVYRTPGWSIERDFFTDLTTNKAKDFAVHHLNVLHALNQTSIALAENQNIAPSKLRFPFLLPFANERSPHLPNTTLVSPSIAYTPSLSSATSIPPSTTSSAASPQLKRRVASRLLPPQTADPPTQFPTSKATTNHKAAQRSDPHLALAASVPPPSVEVQHSTFITTACPVAGSSLPLSERTDAGVDTYRKSSLAEGSQPSCTALSAGNDGNQGGTTVLPSRAPASAATATNQTATPRQGEAVELASVSNDTSTTQSLVATESPASASPKRLQLQNQRPPRQAAPPASSTSQSVTVTTPRKPVERGTRRTTTFTAVPSGVPQDAIQVLSQRVALDGATATVAGGAAEGSAQETRHPGNMTHLSSGSYGSNRDASNEHSATQPQRGRSSPARHEPHDDTTNPKRNGAPVASAVFQQVNSQFKRKRISDAMPERARPPRASESSSDTQDTPSDDAPVDTQAQPLPASEQRPTREHSQLVLQSPLSKTQVEDPPPLPKMARLPVYPGSARGEAYMSYYVTNRSTIGPPEDDCYFADVRLGTLKTLKSIGCEGPLHQITSYSFVQREPDIAIYSASRPDEYLMLTSVGFTRPFEIQESTAVYHSRVTECNRLNMKNCIPDPVTAFVGWKTRKTFPRHFPLNFTFYEDMIHREALKRATASIQTIIDNAVRDASIIQEGSRRSLAEKLVQEANRVDENVCVRTGDDITVLFVSLRTPTYTLQHSKRSGATRLTVLWILVPLLILQQLFPVLSPVATIALG